MAQDDDAAVLTVAASPELIGEARQVLPSLRVQARMAASEADVRLTIGRRFATFPQPDRSPGEWSEWWRDYLDVLLGLSAEAIEAGLQAWIAKPDAEFLPKPGQLRALALASITPTGRTVAILARANEAAREAEIAARAGFGPFELEAVRMKHVPKPPEDREAVRQMRDEVNASYRQRVADRPIPPGNFHLSQGKVDGGGLTEAMRDLLEARTGRRYPNDTRPWSAGDAKHEAIDALLDSHGASSS